MSKVESMDLKIGSTDYLEYINSLLGDDGRLTSLTSRIKVPVTPDNLTPRIFQRKLIEMRAVQEELEQIRLQLNSARMVPDRMLRYLQEEIKLLTTHMRVNDPDVRSGRNIKEQDAIIAEKLSDKHKEESEYTLAITDIDYALTALGYCLSDVKNAQRQIAALEKIWSDEQKGAYRYKFTADSNPLPKPSGPAEGIDVKKSPLSEVISDDFFDDIEEEDPVDEFQFGAGKSTSTSRKQDDQDFDLSEDPNVMESLLKSEFTSDEVDEFLDVEETPDYSSCSATDELDDLLDGFDFDLDDD